MCVYTMAVIYLFANMECFLNEKNVEKSKLGKCLESHSTAVQRRGISCFFPPLQSSPSSAPHLIALVSSFLPLCSLSNNLFLGALPQLPCFSLFSVHFPLLDYRPLSFLPSSPSQLYPIRIKVLVKKIA